MEAAVGEKRNNKDRLVSWGLGRSWRLCRVEVLVQVGTNLDYNQAVADI